MDKVFTGRQHVHLQLMWTEIVFEATNAIVTIFDGDVQIGSACFDDDVASNFRCLGLGSRVGGRPLAQISYGAWVGIPRRKERIAPPQAHRLRRLAFSTG